jgi:hypothetical protein
MRWMFGCAVATALLAAGCASPAQIGARPTPHPNYTSDTSANFFASTVADRLLKAIGKDPTYAGIAIRSFGLQVWAVGGGSPELRAAVAAVDELTVRIADVRNNLHTLEVLTTRLNHDTKALRQRGIAMAMWGPGLLLEQGQGLARALHAGARGLPGPALRSRPGHGQHRVRDGRRQLTAGVRSTGPGRARTPPGTRLRWS